MGTGNTIEKDMMDEVMRVAEEHLPKFTTGALQKRLEKIDALEKQVETLTDEKNQLKKNTDEQISDLQGQLSLKTREVETLQSYKDKDAELTKREQELEKKEFQLTTKAEMFEEVKGLHKESKKEIYDLVHTVFSSQIKTEKISKIFGETPIYNSDGTTVVAKTSEITNKEEK